jgi:exosortase/archaeosortase family protein
MVTTAPGAVSRGPADGSPAPGSTLVQQQGLSRRQLAFRVGVTLAAVVFAYQYSLTTLIRGLSLDTPLAYLGLVPFIALALAVARSMSHRPEPDINDRYVDYIIGIPFMAAALATVLFLSVHASTFYWLYRLDLLSLPLFAAGAVTIAFGVRALWRLKLAIAYLLLAWPLPYVTVLNDWLQRFTDMTGGVVRALLTVLPLASPAPGYDGATFSIGHGDQSFLVSVASACAGVNGMVGFILVGIAFVALVRGRMVPKITWLIGGMALIWVINMGRILLIFLAGDLWGEGLAIDVLHPFIGLVAFNFGVLLMILALPLFGLRLRTGWQPRSVKDLRVPLRLKSSTPVARAAVALTVILVASVVAGFANFQMRDFQLLAQDLGTPRLAQLDAQSAKLAGWSLSQSDSFPWVSRYFGSDASWKRYSYDAQGGDSNPSPFRSSVPVVLDVISTSDLGTLSAFGLQECYRFHNYKILDAHDVQLAAGVTAHSVVYYNQPDRWNWLAVYWEWPVSTPAGPRYERVVVNMIDPGSASVSSPPLSVSLANRAQLAVSDWFSDTSSESLPGHLAASRDFLVGFSQEIVRSAASHSQTGSSGTGGAAG